MALSDREIYKISKKISDITGLGLELGFQNRELERFEQKDNVDLTKKNGTHDMLKQWRTKGGSNSTRAELVKALRASDDKDLAERVNKGEFSDSSPQPDEEGAAAMGGAQPSADGGITDETLRNIGKAIFTNLDELASALGVSYSELKKHKATNTKTDEVTSDGTVNMLFNWRDTCEASPSEKRNKLREALKTAKLHRIQTEYLP